MYIIGGHGRELYDRTEYGSVKHTEVLPLQVSELDFLVPSGTCAQYSLDVVLGNLSMNHNFYRVDKKTRYDPTYTDINVSFDVGTAEQPQSIGGSYFLLNGEMQIIETVDDGDRTLSQLIAHIVSIHPEMQAHKKTAFPLRITCITCRGGRQYRGDTTEHDNMLLRKFAPIARGGKSRRNRRHVKTRRNKK
jgi:hypothetical protein